MNPSTPAPERDDAIAELAALLPRRTEQFGRVMARLVADELPRGMASVLAAVEHEPQRITAIAAREAVAQPTATRMVERLERQGLVARRRDPDDGRSVMVSITDAGREALGRRRTRYRAVLREHLATLADDDLHALVEASAALQALVDRLHAGARG